MNIFLAPHSDDEALFGSFIIQRTKPLIVVCTNGTSHETRFGIHHTVRQHESKRAAEALGVEVIFLGIAEEELTISNLSEALHLVNTSGLIFAPRREGGQPQHDIVSQTAEALFTDRVLYYGTYTRENFRPTGEMALIPTDEEKAKKEQALSFYTSQHGINAPHFEAVKNVPEYLSFKPI